MYHKPSHFVTNDHVTSFHSTYAYFRHFVTGDLDDQEASLEIAVFATLIFHWSLVTSPCSASLLPVVLRMCYEPRHLVTSPVPRARCFCIRGCGGIRERSEV